ncbi:MAG: hypothetical protein FRX49_07049 [Trebouxia sp. A1-2]|nr:MAG: hypothetical protein FRX49_07049 [Trebouxia sp. A1-2]
MHYSQSYDTTEASSGPWVCSLRTLYWQSDCSKRCKDGDGFHATWAVRQELQKVEHGIWDAKKDRKTDQREDITTNVTVLAAQMYA